MRSDRRWQVGFAVLLVVHLAALYWPRVDLAGAPQDSEKLAHVLLFAIPVFVGMVAVRRWWPAVLLAVHAPLSEYLQAGWLPGRSGTTADAIADLVGVVLGSALALTVLKRRPGLAQLPSTPGASGAAHRGAPTRRLPGRQV